MLHWAEPVALISDAKVGKISMHVLVLPSLTAHSCEQRKKKRLPPEDESLSIILPTIFPSPE